MFNTTEHIIEAYSAYLGARYEKEYGLLEPEYPNIIKFMARLALENIANSDAAYHNLEHTMMVTDVGQTILQGKHLTHGGVKPNDWLHFVIACLFHDIGYVRGVIRGDESGKYIYDRSKAPFEVCEGATDASLAPVHVDRAKLFVNEWFQDIAEVEQQRICSMIEITRFPIPDGEEYKQTNTLAGLCRAADLIGQMGDPNYTRKSAALYYEFEESGVAKKLGYNNPAQLRAKYPSFFWDVIAPLVQPALDYLQVTQEGKIWRSQLFSHVFVEEHNLPGLGAER